MKSAFTLNNHVTLVCRLSEVIFNEHFTSGVDHLERGAAAWDIRRVIVWQDPPEVVPAVDDDRPFPFPTHCHGMLVRPTTRRSAAAIRAIKGGEVAVSFNVMLGSPCSWAPVIDPERPTCVDS